MVDAIILGEIRFGIEILPPGTRRKRLQRWFADGVRRLTCLSWDAQTGLRWAKLLAELRAAGAAMPIKDSMIAATALVHGLTVATRNQTDFHKAGVKVVNPFCEDINNAPTTFVRGRNNACVTMVTSRANHNGRYWMWHHCEPVRALFL